MKIIWTQLLSRFSFWLLTEFVLNLIGLDMLADYGEYLLFRLESFPLEVNELIL